MITIRVTLEVAAATERSIASMIAPSIAAPVTRFTTVAFLTPVATGKRSAMRLVVVKILVSLFWVERPAGNGANMY
jgi:hypothetical protein